VSLVNYTARECRNEAQDASPSTGDPVPCTAICLRRLISVGRTSNETAALGTHAVHFHMGPNIGISPRMRTYKHEAKIERAE
jgi:hypothetical protein